MAQNDTFIVLVFLTIIYFVFFKTILENEVDFTLYVLVINGLPLINFASLAKNAMLSSVSIFLVEGRGV